jgi:CDP-glycerol glycerophosphotransferase (TagB/SpsB family)
VVLQCSHPEELIYFSPPLADAITVDGNYWREYLSRNNVDFSKIWITGPAKLDISLNTKLGLRKLSLEREIDKSKNTVIFTTPYSSLAMGVMEYEKIEKFKSVCNALKSIDNIFFVVKLHPFDNDWDVYEKIVKAAGLSDYNIVKNVDMLSLLGHCDLLITYFSVVGYEAVLMDKNVILLSKITDFRSDDVWDFGRFRAVIAVDNYKELEHYIRQALFDAEVIARLRENRKEYILEHAYRLDGDASSRIKEVIDKFA